jgi:Protein of unknown function (DUF402)
MEVVINFLRPGKGITRYIEGLVDEDSKRIKTLTRLPTEVSRRWCKENWWKNGFISQGTLVEAVVKYLYFRKWYSVMQVLGADGRHLGYYVDIDTPIHRVGNEVYLTDLFLDLWIAPDGSFIELDRQEFEEGFQSKLITPYQVRKANQTLKMIVREIASGDFFSIIY